MDTYIVYQRIDMKIYTHIYKLYKYNIYIFNYVCHNQYIKISSHHLQHMYHSRKLHLKFPQVPLLEKKSLIVQHKKKKFESESHEFAIHALPFSSFFAIAALRGMASAKLSRCEVSSSRFDSGAPLWIQSQ